MKIYVAQIYIEVGSVYPFTHYFQRLISDELTKRISASSAFIQKYGEDFNLIFRMSAKSSLKEPEVQGPTVFKTDKDVEYTIFLTFDKSEPQGPGSCRRALKQLLEQIIIVLGNLEMDVSQLSRDVDDLVEKIINEPKMFQLR